ncbi:MAG: DUF202 domain-containing protein [Deltaproteobacteria bacterium]|nr:DUF202 domain-containing protein [Deltaproteobacteria bacterium]
MKEEQAGPIDLEARNTTAKPPDIMSDDRILLAWQRSHMANERTFLAWCRTSIALLGFGFVVERLDLFLRYVSRMAGLPGEALVSGSMLYLSLFAFALGGVSIMISGARFLRVRRHINRGEPSFSIMPDILVVASMVVIAVMALFLSMRGIVHLEAF